MLKRIPHSCQDISGELRTKEYVQHHEKHARTQFKAFMAELARQHNQRPIAKGRFLEIGCGPGFLTAMLAGQYPQAEINTLELSSDMIAIAKTVVERTQHPCRVRFIEGSVDDRSLMSRLGKFDLVYSTFSLHHWQHPVQAIESIYRALGKNGLMMLFDLKRVSWLYLLPVRNGFINSIRAAYQKGEIKNMMRRAGIKDFRIKTPFPYFWHTVLSTKCFVS
jgi:ubiquinone/menaquinone biosynthesis C-methylase UbiE